MKLKKIAALLLAALMVLSLLACGVKDGNASQYWLDIKKLITPDTEVIRSVPWVQGTDPNPVKPYATQFLKNGKLLRGSFIYIA